MNWPTKVFASYEDFQAGGSPVGGVFPDFADSNDRESIPERYANVPRYYIMLPNRQTWCPWKRAYNRKSGHHGEGWEISGSIPDAIDAKPSINASEGSTNNWHGWLNNGVLEGPEMAGGK